ncbi:hypothetical protein JOM56_008039 [Amanita muscaria]
MGPESTIMSGNDTIKFIRLQKLKDDGTNWVTYRERVMNMLTHKGLHRHVTGTVRKPDRKWRLRQMKRRWMSTCKRRHQSERSSLQKYT